MKELRPTVVHVVQLATYLELRSEFKTVRRGVFVAALIAAAAFVTFAWAANPPDPEPSADDALDSIPVAAELHLTDDGVKKLGTLVGDDCAALARSESIPVIALASGSAGVEVVILPSEVCTAASRLVVSSGNGTVVAASEVDLSEPTEASDPTLSSTPTPTGSPS